MSKLDDLHRCRQTVQALVVEAAIPSRLEAGFEVCAASVLEAELAGAGLVQVLDERDVEVGYVGAEPEVDVGEGGAVRAVDGDGAAR